MRKAPRRTNDPARTRRDIVEAATREFAQKGYSGARVDAIAGRTRTSKRMIYYYFGGKEGLYLAVLEEAYSGIRRAAVAAPNPNKRFGVSHNSFLRSCRSGNSRSTIDNRGP